MHEGTEQENQKQHTTERHRLRDDGEAVQDDAEVAEDVDEKFHEEWLRQRRAGCFSAHYRPASPRRFTRATPIRDGKAGIPWQWQAILAVTDELRFGHHR